MSNAFTQFQALLPSSTTSVVTVTAINTDGTSNVTTLAGTPVRVVGDTVTVGDKAFVKDGAIIRKAPDLTITEVNI